MANVVYPKALEKFLSASINWGTGSGGDTIKAVLVDTAAYTYSATHEFLSDIPSGDRIATSAALTGKTITNGVADANDVVFVAATGDPSEAVVLIKDTGSAATSPLIIYIDTSVGLPITPSGVDITITWNASGIFKL